MSFSLAEAERLARRHPLLVAAGGRRLAVIGAARQAGAILNPTFEWRRENLRSPLQRDEFFTAALPLDAYGRRLALRAAAAATGERALTDSATTARAVEYDVARAYWRAAFAVALRDAAETQRRAVEDIARIEDERARQGAVPEGAALRTRLEADRMRLIESGARAEAERARGHLARALALPFDSVPQPTDSLRLAVTTMPGIKSLLETAAQQRPELLSARARVLETRRRQTAERLGSLPTIGVQFGGKRTAGLQTGTVGIGVTIPLFDRNAGGRERALGELVAAENELRATEAAVDAEVKASVRAYRTLLRDLERTTTPHGLPADDLRELAARGRVVADIATAAYREGAIPLFELLDAERAKADAGAAALRAALDLQLARLDLTFALGLPASATPNLQTKQP